MSPKPMRGAEKMTADDKTLAFKAIEACADVEEVKSLKEALGPDGANRSLFMDYYAEKDRKEAAAAARAAAEAPFQPVLVQFDQR